MDVFTTNISGTTLLVTVGAMSLGIIGLIISFRYLLAKNGALAPPKTAKIVPFSKKYPAVDVFRFSNIFFKLGLAFTLALSVLCLAWTTYEDTGLLVDYGSFEETLIELEIPRTIPPKPTPPPLPPPVIEEVPDDQIIEDEQPDFVDASIDLTNEVAVPEPAEPKLPDLPLPPPRREETTDEIKKMVEEMPRFPGCEDTGLSMADKKKCAEAKLLSFIAGHIKYPTVARENNIEGIAVVQFVVEKDGTISNIKLARDIGAGCGREAQRVVELMNKEGLKWNPGKQQGRPVRVQFNLPVRFKLQ